MTKKQLKILMFIAINAIFISLNAQNSVIEVKMHVTRSSDIQNSLLLAIKEKVHVDHLKTAMDSNYSIIGDTLKVHLSFFDVKAFGPLELNNPISLNEETYVTQWKQHYSVGNHILFLFMNEGDGYEFKKLEISDPLMQKHLFPEVMNFIRQHLPSGNEEVVDDGTRFLANAIMPVWTDYTKGAAEVLVQDDKYKKNRINRFHGNYGFGFFDLIPANSNEVEDLKLVNAIYEDENEEEHWFFSNQYIYTDAGYISGFAQSKVFNWPISLEESDTIVVIHDHFLYNLLTYIEGSGKYDATQKVSSWSWEYTDTYDRILSNLSSLSDTTSNDKLILQFDDSYIGNEGGEISILCLAYNNTWCNVFASDLSREILFQDLFSDISDINSQEYAPWGKHDYANRIHWQIYNNDDDFIEITEATSATEWDYTKAGYVVYQTAFGNNILESVNLNQPTSNDVPKKPSGHIATCFNGDEHKVIHAGSSVGVNQWYGTQKSHLYLGYILIREL